MGPGRFSPGVCSAASFSTRPLAFSARDLVHKSDKHVLGFKAVRVIRMFRGLFHAGSAFRSHGMRGPYSVVHGRENSGIYFPLAKKRAEHPVAPFMASPLDMHFFA